MRYLLVLLLATLTCTPARAWTGAQPDTVQVRLLVSAVEEGLHTLDCALMEALWVAYSCGDGGTVRSCEAARSAYLLNSPLQDPMDSWRGRIEDPLLARRLELLERQVLEARVEGLRDVYELQDSIARVQVKWRAVLEGQSVQDGELGRILRLEESRDRRKAAFEARAAVGDEVGPGLKRLMALRTQRARDLGWDSFYELRLGLDELDSEELARILDDLDELTREPYEAFLSDLRERLGLREIEAWDLLYDPSGVLSRLQGYFPADSLLPRAFRTLRSLGFAVGDLPILLDLEPRDGKSEHAFCFPVDPPGDVRILQTARGGIDPASTFLHEMGHAVHAISIRQPSWILRDGPTGAFNEGMGEFFGQLVYQRPWLTDVAGVPEDLTLEFLTMRRERLLFTIRWYLALLDFEREAYADPSQDLSLLYWKMLKTYLKIPAHPEIMVWAQIPHLVTHPVYVQNYLLADLIAAQVRAQLRERQGGILGHPETGAFLESSLFRHGARFPTADLLRYATGRALDAGFLVNELFGPGRGADATPDLPDDDPQPMPRR